MKILFLTNNDISKSLGNWLITEAGEKVIVISNELSKKIVDFNKPDFVISYNYRYILYEGLINILPKVINLHISLLPWNRGFHPNVWSFLEDTPKGVTIHNIDEGIDTGDILVQKEVIITEEEETLASSYAKLHKEIQTLFRDNWVGIKTGRVIPKRQQGEGSIHYKRDFKIFEPFLKERGWHTSIRELKEKYRLWKLSC
jgi:methionyl-tRNA formyltransferase